MKKSDKIALFVFSAIVLIAASVFLFVGMSASMAFSNPQVYDKALKGFVEGFVSKPSTK